MAGVREGGEGRSKGRGREGVSGGVTERGGGRQE